ncbi:GRAS transcription factor [Rhynchospora pubera]|uniref:GRAS transcription factor n=1 Tax=Rhynchospora pubera TaxID=906938 RepID=A0AAV8GN06_9POAL|nr:GRAS transcription factor [Rhynchospora pubera]
MVLPEENNAFPVKLDGANTFIDSTDHTNISHSIHEKYQNNQNEFMLYPTLDYINRILLEDIDEPFSEYQDVAALSDIEKPLYDIVGQKYPPSPNSQLVVRQSKSNHYSNICILNKQIIPKSTNTSLTQDSRNESLLAKEFQRGVEEGQKFLPDINNLTIDLQVSRLLPDTEHKKKISEIELEEENVHGLVGKPKTRKSSSDENLNILEGRNSKMPMFSTEEITRDEMYDKVLLYHGEESVKEEISRLQEIRKCQVNPHCNQKQNLEENIDLESLLVQCSEAVALGNCKVAEEIIKVLRKHASPVGSGTQRLACILTDGLEARLAGTGSESYRRLVNRQISTREVLKAYHMNITASPLLRISYCFANDYICKVAEDASRIHIIDFGITFGFQWPPLIQALAKRRGGVPKLRITGIDLPQPGFRPAERLNQIGVRLEEYAKSFEVPFEYQCIASLWESICIKDLKIDDDEVLIVNSMFRFMQVRDGTFPTDSPRNQVLKLIKQIKPKGFIIGILNVSYSPFFTTRFKKVLSLYSMLFDMFDTLVPRDDEGRQLMERVLLARPIFNLVACEGQDQVERPETYKQWHKRISQAGFKLLSMDQDIVKACNAKVKSGYHEGFFVQEESGWLLQGWKGRINYGLSVWEPKLE